MHASPLPGPALSGPRQHPCEPDEPVLLLGSPLHGPWLTDERLTETCPLFSRTLDMSDIRQLANSSSPKATAMTDPWALFNVGLWFVFVTWAIALHLCRDADRS